jgi:ribosomal protein L24
MSNRNKLHVRRGDQVQVISGNYKGARGQVLRAIPSKEQVVVEGVAMRKRHQGPTQANPEGGIITFEAPIQRTERRRGSRPRVATRFRGRKAPGPRM